MTEHDRRRWGLRARARQDVPPDSGASLVEVLITIVIMSAVGALVTASVQQMYRSSNYSESVSIDMTQLQTAFQQLDRSVRYATAVTEPNTTATSSGRWYVEWTAATEVTDSSGAKVTKTLCTQLRLEQSSGRLQRRTGLKDDVPGAWTTVASSLVGTVPFTLEPATSSAYPHQRLTVHLEVRAPGKDSAARRRTEFTFTALNTTTETVTTGLCPKMDRP